MATLAEIQGLSHNGNLIKRLEAAIANAADDVRSEAAATANHAARFNWANNVLGNATGPENQARAIIWLVLQNATVVDGYAGDPSGSTVTDNDIQFVVNGLVDFMAGADTAS